MRAKHIIEAQRCFQALFCSITTKPNEYCAYSVDGFNRLRYRRYIIDIRLVRNCFGLVFKGRTYEMGHSHSLSHEMLFRIPDSFSGVYELVVLDGIEFIK